MIHAELDVTPFTERRSVLQNWVHQLTFMQQSVLMAAVRGPDGIRKDHPVKALVRWYRRCFLISAFNRTALWNPYHSGGGSFTGPSMKRPVVEQGAPGTLMHRIVATDDWEEPMAEKGREYFRFTDEIPHHFTLHLMHAAEILGYKHPESRIRKWWFQFYMECVNDMHLFPESEEQMDKRLGDYEAHWREREVVTAK